MDVDDLPHALLCERGSDLRPGQWGALTTAKSSRRATAALSTEKCIRMGLLEDGCIDGVGPEQGFELLQSKVCVLKAESVGHKEDFQARSQLHKPYSTVHCTERPAIKQLPV